MTERRDEMTDRDAKAKAGASIDERSREIRARLHRALDARRQRRAMFQGVAGVFGVGVLGGAVMLAVNWTRGLESHVRGVDRAEVAVAAGEHADRRGAATTDASGARRVAQVATDSMIARRLAAAPASSARVKILSDDELVAVAAAAGHSCGLMRTGDGVTLVPCEGTGETESLPRRVE